MAYEHTLHDFTIPMIGGFMRCATPRCGAVKALSPTPAVVGSGTSESAAMWMPDKQRIKDKASILKAIKESGTYGITDEEGEYRTGIKGSTYRPRRGELFKEQLIVKTGRTRKTTSGRDAEIWQAR